MCFGGLIVFDYLFASVHYINLFEAMNPTYHLRSQVAQRLPPRFSTFPVHIERSGITLFSPLVVARHDIYYSI